MVSLEFGGLRLKVRVSPNTRKGIEISNSSETRKSTRNRGNTVVSSYFRGFRRILEACASESKVGSFLREYVGPYHHANAFDFPSSIVSGR